MAVAQYEGLLWFTGIFAAKDNEWDTVKESFESDHAAGGRIGSIFARCIGSGYPRGVFVHAKGENEIRMLCVPGYQKPLKEQLTAFLEYLMPRFSHEDRAGELFLYECHRVLTDEWSDMTDFLALLNAGTDTDGRCRKQGEKTSMQKPNSSEENEFAEEAVTLEQKVARADIDAIFSKRFCCMRWQEAPRWH